MRILFFLLLLFHFLGFSQNANPMSKIRKPATVHASNLIIGASSLVALNQVWYADFPKQKFHYFNDNSNWFQQDKIGHGFATFQFTSLQFNAYRWSGLPRNKALIYAGSIAWSYQFALELLDAHSAGWGFSKGDIIANTLGVGLFVAQELAWEETKLHVKFGYLNSPYAALRPNVLGKTFSERILKDYNAQSYWLSFSPLAFSKSTHWLRCIELSLGHSADGMIFGDKKNTIFNGNSFQAKREFALSLDLDWSKLPVSSKWRNRLKILNTVKIPFPAVYWRGKTCYVGFI